MVTVQEQQVIEEEAETLETLNGIISKDVN